MRLGFWISFSVLLWATGHGGWGRCVFLPGNCGFWDLRTEALVISDCKCAVCLCSTTAGVSVLGSWGPWLPWGLCFFIPQDFGSRPFRERGLGVWLRLVGALGWCPSAWSLMRGGGAAAIWGFPTRNF